MAKMSTDYGYEAARNLRGTRILLDGATYNNRDWIKTNNGTWNTKTKKWALPMPTNNKTAADLLYQIVTRGMTWAAK